MAMHAVRPLARCGASPLAHDTKTTFRARKKREPNRRFCRLTCKTRRVRLHQMEPVPAKPNRQQTDGDFRGHQRSSTRVATGAGASVGLAVLAAMLASGIALQRSLLRSEPGHVRSTAILFAAGVQAAVASGEKDALLRQKEALIFSASGLEFLVISNGKGEVITEWERTANSLTAERLFVEEVPLTGAARAGSL